MDEGAVVPESPKTRFLFLKRKLCLFELVDIFNKADTLVGGAVAAPHETD